MSPALPLARPSIRGLTLLVAFVAVAIAQIQDQRMREPVLIGLAAGGFVAFGLAGWLGWQFARRFEAKVGVAPVVVLYAAAMAALFLVATVIYLAIESAYRGI